MKFPIFCLFLARVEGFSSAKSDARLVTALHQQNDHVSIRRNFLSHVFVAGLATLGARPVFAAANGDKMGVQPPRNKKIGGLALKIRAVTRVMVRSTGNNMNESLATAQVSDKSLLKIWSRLSLSRLQDELQRDLMQERWDLVDAYPAQLRSFVPIFTTYTDSAFPTDAPTDKGLRVALRYEVGRMFASLERFKQATQRKSLDEAYLAYSEMSLHFDRYLRVGGLYTYYDDMVSTEPYYRGFADDTLVYANPKKDPPLVRDLVILIKGPDKGKTGILIGMYQDGSNRSVIKLDRYKGMREIRVVSNSWVAKRLGEQDPDDVFLIQRKAK